MAAYRRDYTNCTVASATAEATSIQARRYAGTPTRRHSLPILSKKTELPEILFPGARDSFGFSQRLLLRQPLLPVLGERVDVVFGDGDEFSLHESRRRILALRDYIVQHID
jgi:hypothetical protein